MKKITLSIVLCLFFSYSFSQKKQNVYYFDKKGSEVLGSDSADYVRIVQEPDSGQNHFLAQEYYSNGKRKTIGKVSIFEPNLVFEGVVVTYYRDGAKEEVASYKKGLRVGMSYKYFKDGKLNSQTEYLTSSETTEVPADASFPGFFTNTKARLIYFADSLGKEYVTEGNGHFMETTTSSFGTSSEEGNYKDGYMHGEWKGTNGVNKSTFIEKYEMGELIGGESVKDGVTYPYTKSFTLPEFKGGMSKFYQSISTVFRYPEDAIREGIEGWVTIDFTVEKDGTLGDVVLKKSLYSSIDEEAMRVVKRAGKWIPGTERGLPVRVRHNIPLKFTLP
ncbi:MAG: TonB family protein [Pedobacter sp.]|nr:MAG: TonB family protein [Pedobacter sp.]